MNEQLGRDARKCFVNTVHSELSKSGLTPIGRIAKHDWSSTSFLMTIRYASSMLNTKDELILVKFQSSEHFVTAYGFVSCIRESYVYSVSFDERTFSPNLDSVPDENEERNMLQLRKAVKDSLALPLLSDLERTGMFHSPRLFLLPHGFKLAVLEALSGVEIAKLQCVCVELKNLASNNDLWEMKFKKEFPLGAWGFFSDPDPDPVLEDVIWKKVFATYSIYKWLLGKPGGQ